jgi:hypothetical protein
MTTGRINQVTIVDAGGVSDPALGGLRPPPARTAAPRLRQSSFTEREGAPGATPRLAGEPASRCSASPDSHPFAPTEFPKERSTAHCLKRPLKGTPPGAICTPQEEDAVRSSRPEGG